MGFAWLDPYQTRPNLRIRKFWHKLEKSLALLNHRRDTLRAKDLRVYFSHPSVTQSIAVFSHSRLQGHVFTDIIRMVQSTVTGEVAQGDIGNADFEAAGIMRRFSVQKIEHATLRFGARRRFVIGVRQGIAAQILKNAISVGHSDVRDGLSSVSRTSAFFRLNREAFRNFENSLFEYAMIAREIADGNQVIRHVSYDSTRRPAFSERRLWLSASR